MQLFKLLKNASLALMGSLISLPLQAIGIILLARSLGVDRFGAYTFAFEFSFIFSRFAESGLNILATRELAKHRDRASYYLGNLLLIKLALSLFFYIAMMLISEWSNLAPEIVQALWIVGAAVFLQSLVVFLTGVFRAYERQDFEGILTILQAVVFLVAIVVGVYGFQQGRNLTYVVWSLFASYLIMVVMGWYLMVRYLVRPKWQWDSELTYFFVRETIPLAIAFAITATYSRVGVLVLQSRSTPTEVGLFTSAFRLITNLGFIPYILAGAWLPFLSRTAFVKPPEFRLHGMRLYKMLFLTGMPITVGSILLAEPIIDLLYSAAYLPAVPTLQLLMLVNLLFFINIANKTLLESCNRQTQWTIALTIGLVIAVGLSLYLVPMQGAIGASVAALVANFSILLMTLVWVAPLNVWQPIAGALIRITLSSFVMGIGIYLLLPISWLLAAGVGVVLYGGCLVVVGILNPSETLRTLRVVHKKKFSSRAK